MLITLDKMKEYLGIPLATTTYDAALTAAADPVLAEMEAYCQRGFEYDAAYVENVEGGFRVKYAWLYPVAALPVVEFDGVAAPAPLVNSRTGRLEFSSQVTANQVKLTYAGGYEQADVPADLGMAFSQACAAYGNVPFSYPGGTTGSAPLKTLSLGSGALAVGFDTGGSSSAQGGTYDVSDAPPLLQPIAFTLRRYMTRMV